MASIDSHRGSGPAEDLSLVDHDVGRIVQIDVVVDRVLNGDIHKLPLGGVGLEVNHQILGTTGFHDVGLSLKILDFVTRDRIACAKAVQHDGFLP